MGGGAGLSEYARANLVCELKDLPTFHGALAYAGDEAVGLINCFAGFSTFAAKPLLNIHDIVVHAGARGQGIARALLGWAEQRARELGCCKLTLEVLSNNTRALFGPLQQRLPDALSAPVVASDDVVDVEQGFGGKGGEAGEAVDQADRFIAGEGQRAVEGGQVFQLADQMGLGVIGEPGAAAHRIVRVVVEQVQPGRGNGLVFEVDRNNPKCHQLSPRPGAISCKAGK